MFVKWLKTLQSIAEPPNFESHSQLLFGGLYNFSIFCCKTEFLMVVMTEQFFPHSWVYVFRTWPRHTVLLSEFRDRISLKHFLLILFRLKERHGVVVDFLIYIRTFFFESRPRFRIFWLLFKLSHINSIQIMICCFRISHDQFIPHFFHSQSWHRSYIT